MDESSFISLCTSTCATPVTPISTDRFRAILQWIDKQEGTGAIAQDVVNAFIRFVGCFYDSLYRHVRDHLADCQECLQPVYMNLIADLIGRFPEVLHCHRSLGIALLYTLQFSLLDRPFMRKITVDYAHWSTRDHICDRLIGVVDDDDHDDVAVEMVVRLIQCERANREFRECIETLHGARASPSSAIAVGAQLAQIRRAVDIARFQYAVEIDPTVRSAAIEADISSVLSSWRSITPDSALSTVHGCVDYLLMALPFLTSPISNIGHQLGSLCTSTYRMYSPVLTHCTPEGLVPEEQGDEPVDQGEDELIKTKAQTFLATAFRAVNAITLIAMSDQIRSLFTADEQGRQDFGQVLTCLLNMLTECTHRGTFEAASTAMMHIGRRWRAYKPIVPLDMLIDKWTECLLLVVESSTESPNHLIMTRRSAGLPQAITALVYILDKSSIPVARSRDCDTPVLTTTMNALIRTALDDGVHTAARLCALHTLRHMLRERCLKTISHDETIMIACLQVAADVDISLQYACAMLFNAAVKRLFYKGNEHVPVRWDKEHEMGSAEPAVMSVGNEPKRETNKYVCDVNQVGLKFPNLCRHVISILSARTKNETFCSLLCLELIVSCWRRFDGQSPSPEGGVVNQSASSKGGFVDFDQSLSSQGGVVGQSPTTEGGVVDQLVSAVHQCSQHSYSVSNLFKKVILQLRLSTLCGHALSALTSRSSMEKLTAIDQRQRVVHVAARRELERRMRLGVNYRECC